MSTEAELHQAFLGEVRARATSWRGLVGNLRLARRFELLPLDPAALVDDAEGLVPDCDRCEDTCCQGPEGRITLRLEDIARLMDAGHEDAIDPEPVTPQGAYARFPNLAAYEALETNRRFPALRQGADGRCVFLDDDERCAIYDIRPLRCRRFPYALTDDKAAVSYAARCQSRRPGTAEERGGLVRAVADNYNAKLKDLVMLEHGRGALERLGIARHLPVVP